MLFRINSNHLCLHNFGEESCSVKMPRPFKFQTGRADCVEVDLSLRSIYQTRHVLLDLFFLSPKRDSEFGYKATKAEVHPNPVGNGRSTIEFFRDSFAMTGREVLSHYCFNFAGERLKLF